MSEKDYVARNLKLRQTAIFELDDLYKVMTKWFDENGYDWIEKDHKEIKRGDGHKKLYLNWWTEKKIDDYVKFHIDIEFFIGCVNVEVEKKNHVKVCQEGEIELKFNAFLEKDYEDRYESRALSKFFRELYDKVIVGDKFDKLSGELFEQLNNLMSEVKAFMGLHEVGK